MLESEGGAPRVKNRFISEVRRAEDSVPDLPSMEGEAEDSDERGQKATVIWEKCIEQSIFVDLSEDESLHLSDFDNSLALHLSKAESAASETSIHLNESANLSALDVTSSESSSVSSQSEKQGDTEGSMMPVLAGIPNTIQDASQIDQRYEDPGQDTSDEAQEDLPYDGDLDSLYFKQTTTSEGAVSSDVRQTVPHSLKTPGELEYDAVNEVDEASSSVCVDHLIPGNPVVSLSGISGEKDGKTLDVSKPRDAASSRRCPADIHLLLLRHFSQEELLQSNRLIEAETLPEVSLLESVDDTVRSLALTHNSTAKWPKQPACIHSLRTRQTDDLSNNSDLETDTDRTTENVTSPTDDNKTSSPEDSGSPRTSPVAVEEEETTGECNQVQRNPLLRARSLSEMKYGQGQVHYPLPDFSKVAPKVKIPKVLSGPARPATQSATAMHRAQSSPGMLDLISRVLEDSVQPLEKPYVFKDEATSRPELAHHLHAEYNDLLTKHAAAENCIDEVRTGKNPLPTTELMSRSECVDAGAENIPRTEARLLGSVTPPLNLPGPLSSDFSCQPDVAPNDGEEMTCELRGIVNEFSEKVEEFRRSVSQMSINTTEQQMMLRRMMEAQDQLERKYIEKKEEHRALEMQNYMGLSRNTGTFDANRLVEGEIFRIGMNLEDIKEIIDRNVCEQISPPHSSSTPTSVKEPLHVTPLSMSPPSPHPSLHQKEEEHKEETEVNEDVQIQLSSKVTTTEASLELRRHSGSYSRSSLASVQAQDVRVAADDENGSCVLSQGIDHSDILAYLSGRGSTCSWRQQTPDSVQSSPSPQGECDVGDCGSLAVQVSSSSNTPRESGSHSFSEPPTKVSPALQRIVSPETDSGFGSSYLNASASGSLQPHLAESGDSHNDALSSSECSCSNLQTAVNTELSPQSSIQTAASGAAAVELWVESTTKVPPVRLPDQSGSKHRTQSHRHHHRSEPALSTGMEAEQRRSPLQSCSCNSEAILALQLEVSKLKKDLQAGLVQLPQLAQKMDYLTSKYRQDREERKSTVRTRKHHRSALNRQNLNCLTSSQVKVDDWISSDMEPSKSKGTDSGGDTASSWIGLHFTDWPVGSSATPEFQGSVEHGSGKRRSPGIDTKHRHQTATTKSSYLKERWSPFSSPDLQKPLLQVSYASSSSLPASYKVREPSALQSEHRKRSTQSDTALLPTNVFFKTTQSPISESSRRSGKDIDRTLDQAIELARSMKRTTDRMAQRLSADLAKAPHHRKLHSQQPLGGRKHHSL